MPGTRPGMTERVEVSALIEGRTIHRAAVLGLLTAVAFLGPQFASRGDGQEHSWDCPVVFQKKSFVDTGDFVYIAGTLTGHAVGHKYNTIAISCHKDRNECLVNTMESIGTTGNGLCQISRLDIPQPYEIEQWTGGKIVATLHTRCGGGETYVIDRKSETAEVTRHPAACPGPFEQTMRSEKDDLEKMLKDRPDLAQDPEFVKLVARVDKALAQIEKEKDTIYHLTIEDPPFWKEFKKKLVKPNVR